MDVSALVVLHITGGTFALTAGATAMLTEKGAALHRMSGSVFFVAMAVMCIAAVPVAIVRDQPLNVTAACFTLYLIATAWVAARRTDGEAGSFEIVAMILGGAVAAGAYAATFYQKEAAPFLYGFGSLAAFGALLDMSVILRRGVSGAQRIARHLWRMSLAMLIATASFFIGQPKFVPAVMKETNLHFVPVVAVMILLFFWLARVLLTKWYRKPEAPVAQS
jgi:uncharacterized membrane protein